MSSQLIPTIPNLGIPVRNIYCIGRNYSEHAKELGNAVPEKPVIFLKPISAICYSRQFIELPEISQRVDYEGEIVVALAAGGRDVSAEKTQSLIAGYGIGIDVTARDLQDDAKKKSLPWSVAKGFDTFAVLGSFVTSSSVADPQSLQLTLWVNGQVKQEGKAADMLFSIPQIIAYLSTIFTLGAGDLIFTGTPPGVGPLKAGDSVRAELNGGISSLQVGVKPRPALSK